MTQGVLFEATAERRNQVEVLSGFGLPHTMNAVLLGCDPKTLRKHFANVLSVGDAKATAKIAQTLYNKALAGDTASLIFWLKARAGWREKHDVVVAEKTIREMSDEELMDIVLHAQNDPLTIDSE